MRRPSRSTVATCVALVAWMLLGGPGCRKDPSLKAARSECEQACAHLRQVDALGARGGIAGRCPETCLESEWTVGDVACIQQGATAAAVRDCGALARVLLVEKAKADSMADHTRAVAQHDDELARLRVALDEEQKKLDALTAQLVNAKSDAEKAALVRLIAEEQARLETIRRGGTIKARPKKMCTPGDPLCTDP